MNSFEVSRVVIDSWKYIYIKTDGAKAFLNFVWQKFDIHILYLMFPNLDCLSSSTKIIVLNHEFPNIFLTAKTLKNDIIEGFKIGANDYITKLRKYLIQDSNIEIENIHGSGFILKDKSQI